MRILLAVTRITTMKTKANRCGIALFLQSQLPARQHGFSSCSLHSLYVPEMSMPPPSHTFATDGAAVALMITPLLLLTSGRQRQPWVLTQSPFVLTSVIHGTMLLAVDCAHLLLRLRRFESGELPLRKPPEVSSTSLLQQIS